jgi:hypothetical protein
MLRHSVSAVVALGALAIGIATIARGQVWIGVIFVGIGLLRAVTVLLGTRPRKPQPGVRLNLDPDEPLARQNPRPPEKS